MRYFNVAFRLSDCGTDDELLLIGPTVLQNVVVIWEAAGSPSRSWATTRSRPMSSCAGWVPEDAGAGMQNGYRQGYGRFISL